MICCFTVKSFLNMSLPTAGMVIGWVSTVINLFQTGILLKLDEIKEFVRNNRGDGLPEIVDIGSPILWTVTLLDLVASILLIIGINKKNHLFLLPWLINDGIFLFIKNCFGIVLIAFVVSATSGPYGHGSDAIFPVILILSILVFLCLVWNAIYSLFQSIRKENDRVTLDTERLVVNSNPCSYELFRNSE